MSIDGLLGMLGYNVGEVALIKRVRKYGTRGLLKVRSAEGAVPDGRPEAVTRG